MMMNQFLIKYRDMKMIVLIKLIKNKQNDLTHWPLKDAVVIVNY